MKTLPAFIVGIALAAAFPNATAQQVVKDTTYQISMPSGWTRAERVPQGLDVGFRKELAEGQQATFCVHHELMPVEAGALPADTSDMKRQWDSMVRNQFPDARPVSAGAPQVNGTILINGSYELTDDGAKVRRRYTYFISGRTAFVVQCSAPPAHWSTAEGEFDNILASLQPGGSTPERQTRSDDAVRSDLKRNLPALLGSFPPPWGCSLMELDIAPATPQARRTLAIRVSFERSDIGEIYRATKLLFGIMKAGKTEAEMNSLPGEIQAAASKSGEFVKYVGQVWGYAFGYVAANCSPPIDWCKISILDSQGRQVGSMSVSREDCLAILGGRVTASDIGRVAAMYVFE